MTLRPQGQAIRIRGLSIGATPDFFHGQNRYEPTSFYRVQGDWVSRMANPNTYPQREFGGKLEEYDFR